MNMLDYLDWRGDLSFAQSELNSVDALIFAWLIYYRFEELDGEQIDGLTLRELSKLHESRLGPFEKLNFSNTIQPSVAAAWLLYRAGETERFGGVRVQNFRQLFDPAEGAQFAAASFLADEETRVIAYRGTDNTLAGWKEDCRLAFWESVPAQRLALQYLEGARDGREVVLCGHSKGGNLAMYAALYASAERCRDIRRVYDFDGPGFCFDIRDADRYGEIKRRTVKVVPESSIVGMLLNHEDDYRIVKSRMVGIFQHDALYWQVMGNDFVYADRRSASSVIMDNALREWIEGMSNDQRREFVDALFAILEGTGAVYTDELPEKLLRGGARGLSNAVAPYPEQRKMLQRLLAELARAGNAGLRESVLRGIGGGQIADAIDRGLDSLAERFAAPEREASSDSPTENLPSGDADPT